MNIRVAHFISMAVVGWVLAGCTSAPSRFYTLNATASTEGTPHADDSILVGPVTIPAQVDRPQFTVQVGPNRVALDEFNRWAGPLGENIANVVAEDLSVMLGTPRVAVAPLAGFNPTCRLALDIQRFETVPGKSVLVDAIWVVNRAGGVSLSGRTVATEPVKGTDYNLLAAAHSRALAQVSRDIAAAIQNEAGNLQTGDKPVPRQ